MSEKRQEEASKSGVGGSANLQRRRSGSQGASNRVRQSTTPAPATAEESRRSRRQKVSSEREKGRVKEKTGTSKNLPPLKPDWHLSSSEWVMKYRMPLFVPNYTVAASAGSADPNIPGTSTVAAIARRSVPQSVLDDMAENERIRALIGNDPFLGVGAGSESDMEVDGAQQRKQQRGSRGGKRKPPDPAKKAEMIKRIDTSSASQVMSAAREQFFESRGESEVRENVDHVFEDPPSPSSEYEAEVETQLRVADQVAAELSVQWDLQYAAESAANFRQLSQMLGAVQCDDAIDVASLPRQFCEEAVAEEERQLVVEALPNSEQLRNISADLAGEFMGEAAVRLDKEKAVLQPEEAQSRTDYLSTFTYETRPPDASGGIEREISQMLALSLRDLAPYRPEAHPQPSVVNRVVFTSGQRVVLTAEDAQTVIEEGEKTGQPWALPASAIPTHQIEVSSSLSEPTAQSTQIRLSSDPTYAEEVAKRFEKAAFTSGLEQFADVSPQSQRDTIAFIALVEETDGRRQGPLVIESSAPLSVPPSTAYRQQQPIQPLDPKNPLLQSDFEAATSVKVATATEEEHPDDIEMDEAAILGEEEASMQDAERVPLLPEAASKAAWEETRTRFAHYLAMINYDATTDRFDSNEFRQKFLCKLEQEQLVTEEARELFPEGLEVPKHIAQQRNLIPQVIWKQLSSSADIPYVQLSSADDPRKNYTLSFDQAGAIMQAHFLTGPNTEQVRRYVSTVDELEAAIEMLTRVPNLAGIVTDPELIPLSWDTEFCSAPDYFSNWSSHKRKLCNLIPVERESRGPFTIILTLSNYFGFTAVTDLRYVVENTYAAHSTESSVLPKCLLDLLENPKVKFQCFDFTAEKTSWTNAFGRTLKGSQFLDIKQVASLAFRKAGLLGPLKIQEGQLSLPKAYCMVTGDVESAVAKASTFASMPNYQTIGSKFLIFPRVVLGLYADLRYCAKDTQDNMTVLSRVALTDYWTLAPKEKGATKGRNQNYPKFAKWLKEICATSPEKFHVRIGESTFTKGRNWMTEATPILRSVAEKLVKTLSQWEKNRDRPDSELKFRLPPLFRTSSMTEEVEKIFEPEPLNLRQFFDKYRLAPVIGVHHFGAKLLEQAMGLCWKVMNHFITGQNEDFSFGILGVGIFRQKWESRMGEEISENALLRQKRFEIEAVTLRRVTPRFLAPYSVILLGELLKIVGNHPIGQQMSHHLVAKIARFLCSATHHVVKRLGGREIKLERRKAGKSRRRYRVTRKGEGKLEEKKSEKEAGSLIPTSYANWLTSELQGDDDDKEDGRKSGGGRERHHSRGSRKSGRHSRKKERTPSVSSDSSSSRSDSSSSSDTDSSSDSSSSSERSKRRRQKKYKKKGHKHRHSKRGERERKERKKERKERGKEGSPAASQSGRHSRRSGRQTGVDTGQQPPPSKHGSVTGGQASGRGGVLPYPGYRPSPVRHLTSATVGMSGYKGALQSVQYRRDAEALQRRNEERDAQIRREQDLNVRQSAAVLEKAAQGLSPVEEQSPPTVVMDTEEKAQSVKDGASGVSYPGKFAESGDPIDEHSPIRQFARQLLKEKGDLAGVMGQESLMKLRKEGRDVNAIIDAAVEESEKQRELLPPAHFVPPRPIGAPPAISSERGQLNQPTLMPDQQQRQMPPPDPKEQERALTEQQYRLKVQAERVKHEQAVKELQERRKPELLALQQQMAAMQADMVQKEKELTEWKKKEAALPPQKPPPTPTLIKQSRSAEAMHAAQLSAGAAGGAAQPQGLAAAGVVQKPPSSVAGSVASTEQATARARSTDHEEELLTDAEYLKRNNMGVKVQVPAKNTFQRRNRPKDAKGNKLPFEGDLSLTPVQRASKYSREYDYVTQPRKALYEIAQENGDLLGQYMEYIRYAREEMKKEELTPDVIKSFAAHLANIDERLELCMKIMWYIENHSEVYGEDEFFVLDCNNGRQILQHNRLSAVRPAEASLEILRFCKLGNFATKPAGYASSTEGASGKK